MPYPEHMDIKLSLVAKTLKEGKGYRLRWIAGGRGFSPDYECVLVQSVDRISDSPFCKYETLHTIPMRNLSCLI